MSTPLSVLLIEDSEDDAELLRRELIGGGFDLRLRRVDTKEAMTSLLHSDDWHVVISDYSMPRFSGLAALRVVQEMGRDMPFIVVSGTIGEDVAVEAMRAGAHDYVMKGNLRRLVPAVKRELREADVRAARRRSEEALRALQKAVETLPIGVTVADAAGRIVYTNPAEAHLHGYTVEELVGREARILVEEQYWSPLRPEQIRELAAWKRERVNRRKDGSTFPAYLISDAVRTMGGDLIGIVTVCEDITERKRTEEQLLRNAFYDPLTALPNRALFMDRLGQTVERARRRAEDGYAVVFLDVDRFKVVNDSLGHTAGDQLLVGIARRLESCVRPGDTLARLGGDEFALLLEEVAEATEAVLVAQRIQRALGAPFHLDGHEVFSTVSAGIAVGTPGYQLEEILRDADTAMHRAKAAGRAGHEVFDAAMHAHARGVLEMEADLRRSLDQQDFVLHYQPLVRLESGETDGLEALVRWNHPQRGLLLPAEFIPLAEDIGLIGPLGEWVLLAACKAAQTWRGENRAPWVAVNVSARQFRQKDMAATMARVLAASGLPPSRLEVELTESAVMENVTSSIRVLEELKSLGVRISIDDFGTGYSSLSYLKLFPVDTLKIDRSFVSHMTTDRRDAAIVSSIIALAHSLGLSVVAEGVETTEQRAFLLAQHCDLVQGYLVGRPAPLPDSFR